MMALNIGTLIDDLWSDEGCSWHIRFDGGRWWTVVLEWHTDRGVGHHANWCEYTWEEYDESLTAALDATVAWLTELVQWRSCRSCGGEDRHRPSCAACGGTGLDVDRLRQEQDR